MIVLFQLCFFCVNFSPGFISFCNNFEGCWSSNSVFIFFSFKPEAIVSVVNITRKLFVVSCMNCFWCSEKNRKKCGAAVAQVEYQMLVVGSLTVSVWLMSRFEQFVWTEVPLMWHYWHIVKFLNGQWSRNTSQNYVNVVNLY